MERWTGEQVIETRQGWNGMVDLERRAVRIAGFAVAAAAVAAAVAESAFLLVSQSGLRWRLSLTLIIFFSIPLISARFPYSKWRVVHTSTSVSPIPPVVRSGITAQQSLS